MTSINNLAARSRAAFWVATCVIVQTLWTSAAPQHATGPRTVTRRTPCQAKGIQ